MLWVAMDAVGGVAGGYEQAYDAVPCCMPSSCANDVVAWSVMDSI